MNVSGSIFNKIITSFEEKGTWIKNFATLTIYKHGTFNSYILVDNFLAEWWKNTLSGFNKILWEKNFLTFLLKIFLSLKDSSVKK